MTVTAQLADTSGPELDPRTASRAIAVARRPLSAILAVAAVAVPFVGLGGPWTAVALLLLGALIATGLTAPSEYRQRLSVAHWLPAGFALALTAVTAIGLAGNLLSTTVWGDRGTALITWTSLVAAAVAPSLVRGNRVRPFPNLTVAVSVALPLAAVAAITAVLPFEVWARIVSRGTDFPRHVVMVMQTGSEGFLDYATNPYPRSVHASASLVEQAAGSTDYFQAWHATEALLLVMLALIAAASAMIAERLMRSLEGPAWLAAVLVPATALTLVLFGPFVTGIVSLGYITTVQAALILTSGALLYWDGSMPHRSTTAALFMLCALLCNTWILLLPLAALPTALYGYRLLRSRRHNVFLIATALGAAAVSAPVIWVSITEIGLGATATPGGTVLPGVGVAWLAILLTAGLGVIAIRRSGRSLTAYANMLFLLGLMLVLVILTAIWDGTGDGSYYLIKSAWTPLPVLIGLGVPGVVWFVSRRSRRVQIGAFVLLVALAATTLPHSVRESAAVLTGRNFTSALVLTFLDQVDALNPSSDRELLVWGLLPHKTDATGFGSADYVATTAAVFQGFGVPGDDALQGIRDHDPVAICRYLESHPNTIRVTGPYLEGPLQWLTDAGCPASITEPHTWKSVEFGPEWYVDTNHEDAPFGQDYPTWSQSRQESGEE